MISKNKIVLVMAGASLIFGFTIMGCAEKVAVPNEKIANAERAISGARESNAIVNAPLDLRISEDKLKQAKEAVAAEEYVQAGRLADEATLDADVARAKTRAAKAKEISGEMRNTVDSMRKELERSHK
ncbi:MAG: hypothetical protein A4E70_02356 [Syntrophus sp. PtaU1.Bin005]|jgi:hypothetical protein|uniref:DUF4398 domain-containing protein n=1 Tax=Syntrophus TaxID=43773 RepID=UPI0009D35825|nr:MAG: hypothetical protein A4E69_03261 [Syntrophus sp. PtaB.Bin138]OPY78584.1 MAG: hypothetical protein A4E70_02356 [Syntrophus sp. PtaU1.Bin005]